MHTTVTEDLIIEISLFQSFQLSLHKMIKSDKIQSNNTQLASFDTMMDGYVHSLLDFQSQLMQPELFLPFKCQAPSCDARLQPGFIHTHYLQITMLSDLKPWQQAFQSSNTLKLSHVRLIKIHLLAHQHSYIFRIIQFPS